MSNLKLLQKIDRLQKRAPVQKKVHGDAALGQTITLNHKAALDKNLRAIIEDATTEAVMAAWKDEGGEDQRVDYLLGPVEHIDIAIAALQAEREKLGDA